MRSAAQIAGGAPTPIWTVLPPLATPEAATWLAGLPEELSAQRGLLWGLLRLCEETPGIRWMSIGCSLARGAADRWSDLDLAMGLEEAGFDQLATTVELGLAGLSPTVEVLRHQLEGYPGRHHRLFAQYRDGTQIDLVLFPETLDPTTLRNSVLLHGSGGRRSQPLPVEVPAERVREWSFLAWIALADLSKYLRRGSLWEAQLRLQEARGQLFRLLAAANGVPEPEFGLTSLVDHAPGAVPPELEGSLAGLRPEAIQKAAIRLAALLSWLRSQLPQPWQDVWPVSMESFVTAQLSSPELLESGSSRPPAGGAAAE